jgi:hypothetical protein
MGQRAERAAKLEFHIAPPNSAHDKRRPVRWQGAGCLPVSTVPASRERQATGSRQRRGRSRAVQRAGSAGLQDTGQSRASTPTATGPPGAARPNEPCRGSLDFGLHGEIAAGNRRHKNTDQNIAEYLRP